MTESEKNLYLNNLLTIKTNLMQRILSLAILLVLASLTGKCKNATGEPLNGIWIEKQTREVSVQWLFNNLNFERISYYVSDDSFGGQIKKGKLTIDFFKNSIKFDFTTLVTDKTKATESPINDQEEWRIVSLGKDRIVLHNINGTKNNSSLIGDTSNNIILVRPLKLSDKDIVYH
jgi:hypothetical protein